MAVNCYFFFTFFFAYHSVFCLLSFSLAFAHIRPSAALDQRHSADWWMAPLSLSFAVRLGLCVCAFSDGLSFGLCFASFPRLFCFVPIAHVRWPRIGSVPVLPSVISGNAAPHFQHYTFIILIMNFLHQLVICPAVCTCWLAHCDCAVNFTMLFMLARVLGALCRYFCRFMWTFLRPCPRFLVKFIHPHWTSSDIIHKCFKWFSMILQSNFLIGIHFLHTILLVIITIENVQLFWMFDKFSDMMGSSAVMIKLLYEQNVEIIDFVFCFFCCSFFSYFPHFFRSFPAFLWFLRSYYSLLKCNLPLPFELAVVNCISAEKNNHAAS